MSRPAASPSPPPFPFHLPPYRLDLLQHLLVGQQALSLRFLLPLPIAPGAPCHPTMRFTLARGQMMPTSHIHRFEQLVYILTSEKFFSAAVRASYRYIKRRPTLSHVVSSSMPYLPHNPRLSSLASRCSLRNSSWYFMTPPDSVNQVHADRRASRGPCRRPDAPVGSRPSLA